MSQTATTMSNQLDKPKKKPHKKAKPTTPAKRPPKKVKPTTPAKKDTNTVGVETNTVEAVTPEQRKKIDAACQHISKIVKNTIAKGTLEVGQYVLKEFFDDDPEVARSRSSKKKATFRMLTDRCDTEALPMSKSWLHNAVGLAIQTRELNGSSDVYSRLSYTHQVRLLPVKNVEDVERLAQEVLDKELSTRQLQERVFKVVARQRKENGNPKSSGKKEEKSETAMLLEDLSRRLLAHPDEVIDVKVMIPGEFMKATILEVMKERSMEAELAEPLEKVLETEVDLNWDDLTVVLRDAALEWLGENLTSKDATEAIDQALSDAKA